VSFIVEGSCSCGRGHDVILIVSRCFAPNYLRMTTTFDEEESKKGLCSEQDYPYLQVQGTCSSEMCTPVPDSIVKDHIDLRPRRTNVLKESLKVGPVTAAMVASDPTFQFYRAGIYQVEGCGRVTKQFGEPGCNVLYEGQDTCLPDINHGVLVVGYGKDDAATTDVKTSGNPRIRVRASAFSA